MSLCNYTKYYSLLHVVIGNRVYHTCCIIPKYFVVWRFKYLCKAFRYDKGETRRLRWIHHSLLFLYDYRAHIQFINAARSKKEKQEVDPLISVLDLQAKVPGRTDGVL